MEQNSLEVPERCIGIDLGNERSNYCLVDRAGKIVSEGVFSMTRDGLREAFGDLGRARVVLESCPQSHWVVQVLAELGHEPIVANTHKLSLISRNVCKTDRNDARLLARIGRLDVDLLHPVEPRTDGEMAARSLLRVRKHFVRTRTQMINQVRSAVKGFGHRIPSCSTERFHVVARRHIPEILGPSLFPLLEMLEIVGQRIQAYDREVDRLCKEEFPQTAVCQQVRGIGPIAALSFVTAIGDPRRFERSRSVGPYLGLTPRKHDSGDSQPQLPISKHGDGDVRSLLVTASIHTLRQSAPDSDLKRYGRRIAASNKPKDRGRARIAVARKIAVLLHRLLLTGEVYHPLRENIAPVTTTAA